MANGICKIVGDLTNSSWKAGGSSHTTSTQGGIIYVDMLPYNLAQKNCCYRSESSIHQSSDLVGRRILWSDWGYLGGWVGLIRIYTSPGGRPTWRRQRWEGWWLKFYDFKWFQNQNESINNMNWSKCPKRVHVAKADLLFLFANEMKWGCTWKKVKSLNVKYGPNVIAGLKCKGQNNNKKRKADKCYVNYESWTRKEIHIFQVDFQQTLSLCWFYKLWISFQNTNKMCAKQPPLFPMSMCKLL